MNEAGIAPSRRSARRDWYGTLRSAIAKSRRAISGDAVSRDIDFLKLSPLFDAQWYLQRYPDVRDMSMDPLRHYVERGTRERRDPHPLFHSGWYLDRHPDVATSGTNPLVHFLRHGGLEGRDPNPLFDSAWYRARYADVREAAINPLLHYVLHGGAERRDPSPAFNAKWYAEQARLPRATNPLQHYVDEGIGALLAPNRDLPTSRLEALSWRKTLDSNYFPLPQDIVPLASFPVAAKLEEVLARNYEPAHAMDVRRCVYFLDFHLRAAADEDALVTSPEVQEILSEIRLLSERRSAAAKNRIDATILIPTYNNIVHTLCCVRAILGGPVRCAYEILIADDCPGSETSKLLDGVAKTIRVIRSDENVGFTRNCNRAAALATGEVLVLLNNDTIPLPYWLDELVDLLRTDASVGLAGSMLLNGDGSLQEAGGIIMRDGSGWNYGRGGDARRPEYNYLKEVDYISGAAIAVRLADWRRLDGFDERYSPAYYEDVDLAFRVRAAGLRTVYQPFSRVVHHEGASHGSDISRGIKAMQVINGRVFHERWQQTLSMEQYADAITDPRARDRSNGKRRILIIDHYVPEPDRDSGSRALLGYVKLFVSLGFHVIFWPYDRAFREKYTFALQRLGVEVIYQTDTHLPVFEPWMRANGSYLDYVLISRPNVASHVLEPVRAFSTARILFFGVDIHFLRLEREFKATGNPLARQMMSELARLERDAWSKSDVIYYYSEEETRVVLSEFPEKAARTIPIFLFDAARLAAARARIARYASSPSKQVIYVAGFRHPPNIDGLMWFVTNVWPHVLEAIGNASLVVVGSFPPPEVRALGSSSITITDYVSDEVLQFMYLSSAVAVVPLRYGAGVKGKVLEAISFGTPVVTTPTGVQGIPGAERMLGICEEPQDMTQAVVALLREPAKAAAKALAGLEYLETVASAPSARRILAQDLAID